MERTGWLAEDRPQLFLDLVNTLESYRGRVTDILMQPALVPDWLRDRDLVTGDNVARLRQRFETQPRSARRWLAALRALRTTLRSAAEAVIEGSLADEQIEDLNRVLGLRAPAPRMARAPGDRYVLVADEVTLSEVLVRLVASFVHLVVTGPVDRLRKCGNAECSYMFLDVSPTGQRRWCSMRTCGNQSKVANYQKRRRISATRRERGRARVRSA